ncbi:universal stress protein [Cognatishimia activa]|uniref:Universal stress protein G n=1 Tax=Cognatishimia activa TaxID=1715691 RepID=A0A0P1IR82_9RHOB|nr:universal stress protein [Cognatishimia activa]MEE2944414.1 universal stress protein [Pseudomonadota bacterium]CUJ07942.1 Universal stress protein G [Cognatishimia activa]CUK25961.1 Universal stress protein G [Cognatishimia activa]
MYKKVLVPMALDHGISPHTLAIAKANCAEDGEITALHVFEVPKGSVSVYIGEDTVERGFQAARNLLEKKVADMPGVKAEITRGQAHHAITRYAMEHSFDCIVIGSHKPGLTDYLIGSTAARVVRHAPCAVHVHRDT